MVTVIHIINENIYIAEGGATMKQATTSELIEVLVNALPRWFTQVPISNFVPPPEMKQ